MSSTDNTQPPKRPEVPEEDNARTLIAPVPAAFRSAIEAAGPGVETMASPTACRTYNVLLSEGRRVGLALLPV